MFILTNIYKKINKLIKLNRPLIIFNIDTTGLSISADKIVTLAYIKIWKGDRVKKEEFILNPEIKISPEAVAFHGIRNRDVKDKPTFRDKSKDFFEIFNDCFYSGFNIMNFDLPLLRREFIRVGMDFNYDVKRIIDSREVFQYMVPRTLSSAYEYYCKKGFTMQHSSLVHAETSAEVLLRQLEKYQGACDWKFLNKIHQAEDETAYIDSTRKFYWRNGEAYFAFSKYKDQALAKVAKDDPKFIEWLLTADFSEDMKNIVRLALRKWGKINYKQQAPNNK